MNEEVRILQDESSKRIASVLHYLIFHEPRDIQLYHELRLSVGNDTGKFSEILSRAQREFLKLKDDPEHVGYVVKLMWPNPEDIMNIQRHHAKYGKTYIQLLLGIVAGVCPRCIEERHSYGGE